MATLIGGSTTNNPASCSDTQMSGAQAGGDDADDLHTDVENKFKFCPD